MFGIIKKIIAFFTKKKNIEKEQIKFIDNRAIHSGHKLFQYDWTTRQLTLAKVEKGLNGRKRVIMEKNCVYVSGLNRKSAIKKLNAKGFKTKVIE